MGKIVTELKAEHTPSRKCKVALVDPSDITYVWDSVLPLLTEALKYSEGELEAEDLVEHLDKGDLRMWVAMRDGDIIACMVTEIICYPRKKIVRVITLSGKDMDMWYDFLPMMEGYAVKHGCSSLEAWTRRGMTRKLKDWKHSYDIITKDIKQRMQ